MAYLPKLNSSALVSLQKGIRGRNLRTKHAGYFGTPQMVILGKGYRQTKRGRSLSL
jgi:hypothetical protein